MTTTRRGFRVGLQCWKALQDPTMNHHEQATDGVFELQSAPGPYPAMREHRLQIAFSSFCSAKAVHGSNNFLQVLPRKRSVDSENYENCFVSPLPLTISIVMNTHALHIAAHELDVLEAFVHDCTQQLPRLQPVTAFASNSPAAGFTKAIGSSHHNHHPHLPGRCATYHTTCSVMLKQALAVLSPLSPRLARLIAQIWDLASLNMFALLQLAHATLAENEVLLAQCEHSAHFEAERIEQETERATRIEKEREQLRIEAQHLRAELQSARQRANRLAVEKTQLRRVLSNLLDGALEPGSESRHSLPAGSSRVINEFVEDVAAVGDAEEQELYGIDGDALDAMETAHPLERAAADLDHVLQALVDGEAQHVTILNSMDRFVNSNAVGLLWRYGSIEEQHQLMERMTRMRHAGTQTMGDRGDWNSGRRNSLRTNATMHDTGTASDGEKNDSEDESDEDIDDAGILTASGASGHAEVVTRTRAIPATLRAQLSSRPKIHRVLEAQDVAQLILELYIEKLDLDAENVRKKLPRLALHPFLKQAFVARYGIASLADYHLMELIKSCLFHHEKYRKTITTSINSTTTDSLLAILTPTEHPHQHASVDVRVALFARVCELVPFELSSASDVATSSATSTVLSTGNLLATCLNVLVDLLGDIVELDPSIASLNDVEKVGSAKWWCPLDRATLLITQHLGHIEHDALVQATARLASLSGPDLVTAEQSQIDSQQRRSSANFASDFSQQRFSAPVRNTVVAVDVLLALFSVVWLEYDQRLTTKLRDGFRRQLMLTSPLALQQTATLTGKAQAPSSGIRGRRTTVVKSLDAEIPGPSVNNAELAPPSPPIEILMRVFASLPDESLSLRTLEELRNTLNALLATKLDQIQQQKQQQQQQQPTNERGRRVTKRMQSSALLTGSSICIGGVSEKEFVFHALQVLRTRRACYGVRTNGRRLVRPTRLVDQSEDGNGEDDVITIPAEANPIIWVDDEDLETLHPVAPEQLKAQLVRKEW